MEAMGVKVHLNTRIGDIKSLLNVYTAVVVAAGAWNHGSAGLEYGEELNVISFLETAKKVLAEEYPELEGKIVPELPDEKFRRVGQSMAAASLPELKK